MKNGDSSKAQLHTLEGLAGSVVLLLAITYAFSAFVVTPTSDVKPGTDTNQKVAQDLLGASSENGDLKNLTTHWNASAGRFINSTDGVYYYENKEPDPANLSIGNASEKLFTEQGLSYNIDVTFFKDSGTGTLTIVDNGNPGSSAVSATQTVVLEDNDTVVKGGSIHINNTSRYPIPKQGERIYNRAEVTVTVW
jgi:hypothetical protein